jgi:DNA helicase-2/ATP-dependent DNA helicase PcrA
LLENGNCQRHGKCKILEKTEAQLNYILSPNNECIYLEACAGSGKTEVLGMKAAYEIYRWPNPTNGLAVLTFTNEATNTINGRIQQLCPSRLSTSHYIGTFASFVHGYIAQKFGYSFYRKGNENKDKSFSVIDTDIRSYNNEWLSNYAVDFPLPPQKGKLYANQIEFQLSSKKWYIQMGDSGVELSDYYNYPDVQKYITDIRNRKRNNELFKLDYLKKQVIKCKQNFWRAGFATFEDMKLIAYRCLKEEQIATCLSKKFPLIMVDECQDLSFIELEILNFLRLAGSSIHYIGDLNQAIYSFRDANPEFFNHYIREYDFKIYKLKDNFRSDQIIVNTACKLQGIQLDIIGRTYNFINGEKAVYYEYDDELSTTEAFSKLLDKHNIPVSEAIILTRNTSLKNKLWNGASMGKNKHAIINATQLWNFGTPEARKKSLELIGWQIHKWIGGIGRKDNYFCPENIYSDVFSWRLTLRDILNELVSNNEVNSFEVKDYSKWYNSAKSKVIGIIDRHMEKILGSTISSKYNISWRTPSGTASLPIQVFSHENTEASIKINTIHATKGCSYDAVMLVSSSTVQGKTGYWENWIDDKNETTRFAYVASTRPKYLLCWAVPTLSSEQREKIESIGLTKLKI